MQPSAACMHHACACCAVLRVAATGFNAHVPLLFDPQEVAEVPNLSADAQAMLEDLVESFGEPEAQRVKDIESVTNHDVKAVEYFLKEKVRARLLEGLHRCDRPANAVAPWRVAAGLAPGAGQRERVPPLCVHVGGHQQFVLLAACAGRAAGRDGAQYARRGQQCP